MDNIWRIFKTKVLLLLKVIVLFCFFTVICTIGIYFFVSSSTSNKIYTSTDEIPHSKVGLVLGTSKYLASGDLNLYYRYRIDAAVELFKAGKIDFILVSGDNRTQYYNEPMTFKKDLIERGIPKEKIFLDFAGFRTFDSIVRCFEVFGQSNFTIISQDFHNRRGIFIANHLNINAIAYNAKDVPFSYGIRIQVREFMARVKMMFDLILKNEPQFLGDKIIISD